MPRFAPCTLVFALLAASPAAADWRALDWGLGPEGAASRLGTEVERVDPPRRYGGGLEAPLTLPEVALGGLSFRAWLQFGPDGLAQILFVRGRKAVAPGDFAALVAALSNEWGPPVARCDRTGPAGAPPSAEVLWKTELGTLHAVLIFAALPGPMAGPPPAAPGTAPVVAPPPGPATDVRRFDPRPGTRPPAGTPDRPEPPSALRPGEVTPPPVFSDNPPAPVVTGSPLADPPTVPPRRAGTRRELFVRLHDPAATALAAGLCDPEMQ
jgi:hypothetical protein